MKKICLFVILSLIFFVGISYAGFFDDLIKAVGSKTQKGTDNQTIVAGLKEALSIGSDNAVKKVSKLDGYFGNEMIKILMPEKIQKTADVLRKVGLQKQVDDFVLSMNRAAEKAAPQAFDYFVDAIKQMTFDDAKKILNGGDTAATEFFKEKTNDKIYKSFKPVISNSMNEVGVTRTYKNMIGKYEAIPLMKAESLDLDHYVTNKALDGLFYMIGEEEKKIRKDPMARVTDLLKTVFGK
ncbi:MAG: DUF4197 domain-containing protein [Nitrospiraceae bacterium]|nr:DUF4197 domain-containing protein [Nitrospiraceae bacterium]